MTTHLTDLEIAAAIAGEKLDPRAAEHWAECVSCRQQARDLERLLEARRAQLADGAPDWQAQRDAVLARLAPRPVELGARRARPWLRPALALAATVLITVGLGLLWPDPAPTATGELPVADILAEAEALLASDEIPGFAVIDPGLDTLSRVGENGTS